MPTTHLTESKLVIIQVLWEPGAPCTVREVQEALSRHKGTVYTIVLKMMTITADKGPVHRDQSERSHCYAAAHPQPPVRNALVKDLLTRASFGSAL